MRARIGGVVAVLVTAGCGLVPLGGGGATDTSAKLECPSAADVNTVLGTQVVFDTRGEMAYHSGFTCMYYDPTRVSPVHISFEPEQDSKRFAAYKASRGNYLQKDIAGFQDEAFVWWEGTGDPAAAMREVSARKGSLTIAVMGMLPAEKEQALVGKLFAKVR